MEGYKMIAKECPYCGSVKKEMVPANGDMTCCAGYLKEWMRNGLCKECQDVVYGEEW